MRPEVTSDPISILAFILSDGETLDKFKQGVK